MDIVHICCEERESLTSGFSHSEFCHHRLLHCSVVFGHQGLGAVLLATRGAFPPVRFS